MGKASRNTKKITGPPSTMPSTSELLFAVDTSGDASVRNSLLHAATSDVPASGRLRKGASFNKPLKSDLILAQRSKVPALTGRVVPSAGTVLRKDQEKMGRIDRATKERLNRIAGRDGKGQGLWSVKSGGAKEEALSEEVKNAGGYDAWEVKVRKLVPGEDLALQAVVKASTTKGVPKPPSTFHEHALLRNGAVPRAVPLPHPGTSYNPLQSHHQALLGKALTHYTAVQEREDRGQDTKDAMDEMRKNTKGMEPWQLCQDEVGSGEEDSDAEIGDAEAVELRLGKKLSKRKTRQQRNKKLLIAAEALALATRRANKARTASVLTAPAVISALDESIELSVAEKAADMKVKRARLADRGLTRFRSGPMRVPDAPVTYQLGEELSENLRTLSTEGNLFRSFMDSTYSRGRMAVERASLSKKGGKRGGRGRDKGSKIKWKALYAYKNFVV